MITPENVIKRNRAHPIARPSGLAKAFARLEGRPPRGLHREPWHGIDTDARKQPGRRFGPIPLGPDKPKVNKVTDVDGNARISPLSADRRVWRYKEQAGRMPTSPAMPLLESAENEYDARAHARNLGVTLRQRRRIVHKANRVSGYSARVERHEKRVAGKS